MYVKKSRLFYVIMSAFFLLSFNCALFSNRQEVITDKQKEESIIELLNTRQEQIGTEGQSDDEVQRLKQQIAALENQLSDYEGQINSLKSEIDLKNAKISQLESSQVTITQETEVPVFQAQETKQPATSGTIVRFEEEYNSALEAFRAHQYRDALQRFEGLLQKDRNNALSDNSQYWIGECYFALKDYKQAIIAFDKVLFFPNSNKHADAQFKLGYTRYKMGEMDLAKEELNRMIEQYSDSKQEQELSLVRRAQSLLAEINKIE